MRTASGICFQTPGTRVGGRGEPSRPSPGRDRRWCGPRRRRRRTSRSRWWSRSHCARRSDRPRPGRAGAGPAGGPNDTPVTTSLSPMALSRLTDRVGQVLSDRYRLLAPIGTGASASVYLADDVTLRRRVAVKILHDGAGRGRGLPAPLPGRGPGRGRAQPPERHGGVRLGPRRRALPRHRVPRRRQPAHHARPGPAPVAGPGPAGRARRPAGDSTTPTAAASCTATSSRPTCCSTRRPGCASPTSGWPGPWPRRPGPSRRARCSARPATPRPSRPGARRSTAAATCTRWPWS